MDAIPLDDEIAAVLARTPFSLELSVESIAATRRERDAAFAKLRRSDAVERVDHVVAGAPHVLVRVHRPKGIEGPLPALFSIHGGGYLFGTYEMEDVKFDDFCPRFPCVGVSVEYRLAPETPYPGPLDDCYAALRWTFDHADELGIVTERIGIGGSSAGGGLAAALALLAHDRGELPVAFQLLECPMLDDRQITSSSRLDGLSIWSREANEFGWRAYLGDLYGGDVPHHAAPARAFDLSGLPPAFVIVGTADGFCDEDVDYALRLGQAGVPTELHVLPGAPHGIRSFARTTIARRWTDLVAAWLALQMEQP